MFSKSRRSKQNKRYRKNRFSNNFSIESLERREMFAANLGADMASVFAMDSNIDSRPAAVAAATTSPASALVAGSTFSATKGVQNPPASAAVGQVVVDLPTLGAKVENGVLTVTGSNGNDNIFIFAKDGQVHVCEVVKNLTLLSVPTSQVTSIVVNANGGKDWVNVDDKSINVPATINGGSGDDTLQGGAAGDTIDGGSGIDKLIGRGGNDSMIGGTGDDMLVGGDGNDRLYGNDGNDYLLGGDGKDSLMGEEGNDQLFGENGNDYLYGGAGQNRLDGGTGNDHIYGGDDVDDIFGGDGNDYIVSYGGGDRICGDAGNDNILAGAGSDMVDGGDGDDTIRGEVGNDALSGGAGNDTIYGGDGKDFISGDDGHDLLYGEAGKDWLQGGHGFDTLDGGGSDDKKYQEYAPGGELMGQIASASIVGDLIQEGANATGDAIGDFGEAAVNLLVDIGEWTLDRVLTLFRIQREWVLQLENRFERLGQDLATTFSNFPWEKEFWNGLGRVTLDILEIHGLGEFCQYFFAYNMPWQRGMTSHEKNVARSVFGNAIDYDMVRINEYSVMNAIGGAEAHVFGYVINSNGNFSNETLIHELVHVWQYTEDGLIYTLEALNAQDGGAGYEYGGVEDLRETMNAGNGLSAYNREQQGEIFEDYYTLREELEDYYAIPEADRSTMFSVSQVATKIKDLNVYIHFVREVSSLDKDELDVDDPLAGQSSGNPATNPGRSRLGSSLAADMSPERSGVRDNADVARESVFAQLATPPVKSPTASNLVDAAERGTSAGKNETSLSPAPAKSKSSGGVAAKSVSTRALDRVFESVA